MFALPAMYKCFYNVPNSVALLEMSLSLLCEAASSESLCEAAPSESEVRALAASVSDTKNKHTKSMTFVPLAQCVFVLERVVNDEGIGRGLWEWGDL